jgi:hypothetical protein
MPLTSRQQFEQMSQPASEEMRETLKTHIEIQLKSRKDCPPEWLEKVPYMVVAIEEDIYRHSRHALEYNNLHTLKTRMIESAKRLI